MGNALDIVNEYKAEWIAVRISFIVSKIYVGVINL